MNQVRETNHRSTTTWLKRVLAGQSAVQEREPISREEQLRERLIFGLRMLAGIELAAWEADAGCTVAEFVGPGWSALIDQGWLEVVDGKLRLTEAGLLVSDAIWPQLL